MRGLVAITAALLLGALAVAGCGGGNSDETAEATSISKAEFIKQGDAICKKAGKEARDAISKATKEQEEIERKLSQKEQEEVVRSVVLSPIKQMTDELAELGEPQQQGAEAQAVVNALQKAVQDALAEPLSIFEAGESPFTKAEEQAGEFGFQVCSNF